MKKLSLLHKAAGMVMGVALIASACGEIDEPKNAVAEGHGILSVQFTDPATKAYTEAIGGDLTARGLQVIIFDGNGNFFDVIEKNNNKYQKEVPVGTYTVVAVANGTAYTDATAPNISTLEGVAMSLEASTNPVAIAEAPASGMARYGKSDPVSVTATGATASINAKLLAFRVTLNAVNVSGDANGRLTLTNCFLENIYGNSTLGGTVSNFKNAAGRKSGKSTSTAAADFIAAAADAFGGAATFNTVAAMKNHGKAFYAYSNQASADNFNGPMAADKVAYTRLVIAGTWKQSASSTAETVYYPVTISHNATSYAKPLAGYSYDVTVNITKKGSDDPNKPVPDGAGLTVNVDVSSWTAGPDLTGNF